MAGNFWEWVADWAGTYPTYATTDPTGPASGSRRVNRGGGWGSRALATVHAAARRGEPETFTDDAIGARCAYAPR